MRTITAALILCGGLCSAGLAGAEPVQLTAGRFVIDHEGDGFSFAGPGFEIASSLAPSNYGLWIPKDWSASCFVPFQDEGCAAGELLNLSFTTPAGSDMGLVNATVGGTSYTDISLRGTLDFDGQPFVLPPADEAVDFMQLRLPFAFTGELRGYQSDFEVFVLSVFGFGNTFNPLFFDARLNAFLIEESRTDYVFNSAAPTPEPGTWLLIATGAAGLAARRRRRKMP